MVFRKLLTLCIAILSFFVAPLLMSMEELADNLSKLTITLDNLHSALTENVLTTKRITSNEKPALYYAITSLPGQELIDADLVQNLSNRLGIALTQKNTTNEEWLKQDCPILFYYVPQNATNELETFLNEFALSHTTPPIVILLKFPSYSYSDFSAPIYSSRLLISLLITADGQLVNNDMNMDREIFSILLYLNNKCGINLTASLEKEKINFEQKYSSLREPKVNQPIQPEQPREPKILPTIPPLEIRKPTQPQQPIQQSSLSKKLFGEFLYTTIDPTSGIFDFYSNAIPDLERRLGIKLNRVDSSDPLLENNQNVLYFFAPPGRPESEEAKERINKYSKIIKDKNGRFLIGILGGNKPPIQKMTVNEVSVFYFNFDSKGIVEEENYQTNINELRAALGK